MHGAFKIHTAFQQLYYGDASTQRIYHEVPSEGSAYVTDAKNGDVRTEGMGYGMMVMVQLNNQTGFDMLWKWVKLHLFHADKADPLFGWSAWHALPNGTRLAEGPAPDGETWFITTLYFAAARWGTTAYCDYRKEADTILAAVNSKSPSSQDMFTEPRPAQAPFPKGGNIVWFDPGTSYTDPSYLLPGFYVAWSRATQTPNPARWADAADSARDVLYASINKSTGLGPHSCAFDGGLATNCHGSRNCLDDLSEDDAWRVGRNWALDYTWWANDTRQVDLSNAVLRFFSSHEPYAVFTTAGEQQCGNPAPPCRGKSSGRAAINAVACLASNSSLVWGFVDELWEAPIPSGDNRDSDRYYSGSLYLEALLHLSGNYRAWLPQ